MQKYVQSKGLRYLIYMDMNDSLTERFIWSLLFLQQLALHH